MALINEIWPDRSRTFLAGLIGAAGNLGYLLVAMVGRGLTSSVSATKELLVTLGISDSWVAYLMGKENTGWRIVNDAGGAAGLVDLFHSYIRARIVALGA